MEEKIREKQQSLVFCTTTLFYRFCIYITGVSVQGLSVFDKSSYLFAFSVNFKRQILVTKQVLPAVSLGCTYNMVCSVYITVPTFSQINHVLIILSIYMAYYIFYYSHEAISY